MNKPALTAPLTAYFKKNIVAVLLTKTSRMLLPCCASSETPKR